MMSKIFRKLIVGVVVVVVVLSQSLLFQAYIGVGYKTALAAGFSCALGKHIPALVNLSCIVWRR